MEARYLYSVVRLIQVGEERESFIFGWWGMMNMILWDRSLEVQSTRLFEHFLTRMLEKR